MKDAAKRILACDSNSWLEYSASRFDNRLRVDVYYIKNKRRFLVECETKPNLKRLTNKGKRRNSLTYRNTYILIVSSEHFDKHDWWRLKGYFDTVLAYNIELDVFSAKIDLRLFGLFQDRVFNLVTPIYRSRSARDLYRFCWRTKNRIIYSFRGFIQCRACKLGIETPWVFCPKFDCPDSVPYSSKYYE
jgi:hypothetical protein